MESRYSSLGGRLRVYIAGMVREPWTAEKLAQETFARAYGGLWSGSAAW